MPLAAPCSAERFVQTQSKDRNAGDCGVDATQLTQQVLSINRYWMYVVHEQDPPPPVDEQESLLAYVKASDVTSLQYLAWLSSLWKMRNS